jgi:CBS domain-containing protein
MPDSENNPAVVYGIVITVADVMNPNVISVKKDTPIDKVVEIFTKYNFTGIPVTSDNNTLLGVITQYDLVVKGSGLHIPTLLKTLEGVKTPLASEKSILEDTLKPVKRLVAKDIMNEEPLFLYADTPLNEALNKFAEHHRVNPIVIVNNAKRVIGVLSRHDLIKILALKELGKTVDMAVSRTSQKSEGAETAVAGVVKQIKKEFFFFSKHKATKWVVLAVSLFIIGFLSSIFFVTKLPDFSPQAIPTASQIPVGEGAILSLKGGVNQFGLGQEVPVTISLKTEGVITPKEVIVAVKFNPDLLLLIQEPKDLNPNWKSNLKIINLKDNSLVIDWQPTFPQILTGGSIDLGLISFKALGRGEAALTPDFVSPRTLAGSTVIDFNGQNILDAVNGITISIQ